MQNSSNNDAWGVRCTLSHEMCVCATLFFQIESDEGLRRTAKWNMEGDIKLDPDAACKFLPPRPSEKSAMGREEGNHDWCFQRALRVNTRSLVTTLVS